jgi:hypothetical protein
MNLLDKAKQFFTGETITERIYSNDTPFVDVIRDMLDNTPEGQELTELEFFDESGKRVQHWKKYK